MRNQNKRRKVSILAVMMALLTVTVICEGAVVAHMLDVAQEESQLKREIVDDCDTLTKQKVEMQKQIDLLQEKVQDQQNIIDRLKKLETVGEVKAVAQREAGDSIKGQCAVMTTMLDRTAWDNTPTIKAALDASGQYADPKYPVSENADVAFDLVFLDGYRPFQDPVTHFCSGPDPYWTANKECRGVVDGNRFFY